MKFMKKQIERLQRDPRGLAIAQTFSEQPGHVDGFLSMVRLLALCVENLTKTACTSRQNSGIIIGDLRMIKAALADCESTKGIRLEGMEHVMEALEACVNVICNPPTTKPTTAPSTLPAAVAVRNTMEGVMARAGVPMVAATPPPAKTETVQEKHIRLRDAAFSETDPEKRKQLFAEYQDHRSKNHFAIYG
jgi:hypothetical protein